MGGRSLQDQREAPAHHPTPELRTLWREMVVGEVGVEQGVRGEPPPGRALQTEVFIHELIDRVEVEQTTAPVDVRDPPRIVPLAAPGLDLAFRRGRANQASDASDVAIAPDLVEPVCRFVPVSFSLIQEGRSIAEVVYT